MVKNTFLLVSLQGKKAKKLAEVISNNTSRKLLDFLSKGSTTESSISKELDIPISTVHYNLKALVDAKLVKAEEYTYSKKGKEMMHYKLANQYVIIAPEAATSSLKEKLKSILPAATITVAIGTIAQLLYKARFETVMADAQNAFAAKTAMEATPMIADQAMEAAPVVAETGRTAAEKTAQLLISDVNILLWFLAGAFIFLVSYLFIEYVRKKLK